MYIIKEMTLNRKIFGKAHLPEIGTVDWGRNGENIIEVPDSIGAKLIAYGRNMAFREVFLPETLEAKAAAAEAPVVVKHKRGRKEKR